jgi:hypothetical protein
MRLNYYVVLLYWLGKRFFNRPPQNINAMVKGTFVYPEFHCPLFHAHSAPGNGEFSGPTSIVELILPCCPFYIARSISTFIVNAFKGMFWGRSRTNMPIKLRERRNPSATYCYAPASIIMKTFMERVRASLDHAAPYCIFRRPPHTMNGIPLVMAPTTFSHTRTQGFPKNHSTISARTLTSPSRISLWIIFISVEYGELSKCLSGKINKVFRCCHGVTSWLKVVVEKVCWKAVNQFPLFGSYPIQHEVY